MEKDRFFKIAEIFDRVAQKVVPQYDFLQDEVIPFVVTHSEHQPTPT